MTSIIKKIEEGVEEFLGKAEKVPVVGQLVTEVANVVISDVDKFVIYLKQLEIVQVVKVAISDAESTTLSNEDKLVKVTNDVLPYVGKVIFDFTGIEHQATDLFSIVKAFAQGVFNDVKSSTAASIASATVSAIEAKAAA